jgi:hypothetical protein
MIVLEAMLMGVFATYYMDFWARILVKRKVIYALISPDIIGRWFLSMFKGKFVHRDIYKVSEFKNERRWGFISHFMIGVVLAGFYLLLDRELSLVGDHIWVAVLYGIATNALPWLWLYPGIGLGVFASNSPDRSRLIKTSFVNHANFGFGLLFWMLLFHRFFV